VTFTTSNGKQAEQVEVDLADVEAPVHAVKPAEIGVWKNSSNGPGCSSAARGLRRSAVPAVGVWVTRPTATGKASSRWRARTSARNASTRMTSHPDSSRTSSSSRLGVPRRPPKMDGAGHVHAPRARVEVRQWPRGDEIADVGNRPVVAGLDVLVFPEAIDRTAGDRRLAGNHLDELAQDVHLPGRVPGGAAAILGAVDLGIICQIFSV
jgi:hypothetical protein